MRFGATAVAAAALAVASMVGADDGAYLRINRPPLSSSSSSSYFTLNIVSIRLCSLHTHTPTRTTRTYYVASAENTSCVRTDDPFLRRITPTVLDINVYVSCLLKGFIEVDGTTRNLVIQPPSDGAVDVRGNVTISGMLTNAALVRALFHKTKESASTKRCSGCVWRLA